MTMALLIRDARETDEAAWRTLWTGYLDFYKYVYQPFSAAVHSSWYHISCFDAAFCENPTHRNHRMGHLVQLSPDPHWLYLGAKYLQKTFALFEEKTGKTFTAPTAFDVLLDLFETEGEAAATDRAKENEEGSPGERSPDESPDEL